MLSSLRCRQKTSNSLKLRTMNLGRREYRSYHYIKEEEQDDPEKPKQATDPATGKASVEYQKKNVLIEYYSPYGTDERSETANIPFALGFRVS